MRKADLIFPFLRIVIAASLADAGIAWARLPDGDAARAAREASREVKWKVPEIFQALGVQHGSRIADIGSGDGFLTTRLASAVGPEGKVFAVDIDDRALGELRKRIDHTGTKNVEIIRGRDADPLLAPASVDGAVVLRAYHEFSRYKEMLANIRDALRPGGRLVIIDIEPAGPDGGRTREWQFAQHVLACRIVEKELAEAGFRVVLSLPSFARVADRETAWLIAAERPKSESARVSLIVSRESRGVPRCSRAGE